MKEEIRKELEALGSGLAMEKDKTKFSVPEGYFDRMQEDVISHLEERKHRRSASIRLRRAMYAVAAVILGVLASLFVFERHTIKAPGFDLLESEAIYAYLDENLDDVSLDMLLTREVLGGPIILDAQDNTLIEQYLEDNLDDVSMDVLEELL